MSALNLNLKLTFNPEEVPTSYSLHINSVEGNSNPYRITGIGECNTHPNDENEFHIEVFVDEFDGVGEITPFVLPLFDVNIEDTSQRVVVSASSETGINGKGTIKSVEAQNESRPVG